ncbi:hypothetical protein MTR67_018032 [Solanum verrucosum]|uniref:Uncharacterized protein n=1 Tax=Solanum verrucosum TaxID=315347 RepID=A0AAF0QKZ2_SOLVR|nr:hypothetical protein MTR67_018032 [Solanum verrucosum]
MISKGCIYHIVRVMDVESEVPSLESVPAVSEFLNVFLNDLPSILPKREIDFGIDLLPDTQSISIPPYRMASAFLRQIVSRKGTKVDPKKTDVVKSWPRPLDPSDIRSFLGLAGYYRRFVEHFSSIASLLKTLTQNKARFVWSEACEKNFQEFKGRLTSTTVLTLPEGTNGFVVYEHKKC